jgi:hypothetical protein
MTSDDARTTTTTTMWAWLVWVGCGRDGWYRNNLLDNLARLVDRPELPT